MAPPSHPYKCSVGRAGRASFLGGLFLVLKSRVYTMDKSRIIW